MYFLMSNQLPINHCDSFLIQHIEMNCTLGHIHKHTATYSHSLHMQTKPAVTDHTVIQARQKQRVTDDGEGLPVTFSRRGPLTGCFVSTFFPLLLQSGGQRGCQLKYYSLSRKSLVEHNAHGNFCDLQLKT